MSTLPLQSRLMWHILVLLAAAAWALFIQQDAIAEEQHDELPITRPGCPDKCGDTSIPFPFGMKPGCFLDQGFEVTCDHSFQPPRAFLAYRYGGSIQTTTVSSFSVNRTSGNYSIVDRLKNPPSPPVELIDISVADNQARAYGPVASVCNTNATDGTLRITFATLAYGVDGPKGPFLVSTVRNVLVGIGVEVYCSAWRFNTAAVGAKGSDELVSCHSTLVEDLQLASNGSCFGRGCCQASLPGTLPLTGFSVAMPTKTMDNSLWVTNPCSFAMVVESSRGTTSPRRTCSATSPTSSPGACPSSSISPSETSSVRRKASSRLPAMRASAATAHAQT